MRAVALVFALTLLAGCLDQSPTSSDSEPERVQIDAPVWRAGDWWLHRGLDADGVDQGLVRTEVVSIDEVDGRSLYRVRVTGNFTDSPKLEYYDASLNRVWHKWGDPCGPLSRDVTLPCDSGDRWFAWPLEEGRTWEAFEGGDVIEGSTATATRATHGPRDGEPAFAITFRDHDSTGLLARLVVMSPAVGWYTLNVHYDDVGRLYGASVLVDHGRAADGV